MKFAVIPPGEFKMGGIDDVVDVTLTQPFHFGIHEVTQGQWKAIMGTEPWKGQEDVIEGDKIVATFINWSDATEFCQRLTEQERSAGRLSADKKYRLATDAEWGYACRAGTTTKYFFGETARSLGDYAWYDGNAKNGGEAYAHEVGLKKPNAWGLFDMHGNVWEWCSDWHGAKLPGGTNPTGPSEGKYQVLRGGSWDYSTGRNQSASRGNDRPSRQASHLGFRVVRDSASSVPVSASYDPAAERVVAEWVIAGGGWVDLNGDTSGNQRYREPGTLPKTDFRLTTVRINKNHPKLKADDLVRLQKLSSLEQLSMAGVALADDALQHIKDIRTLKHILIYDTSFSDGSIKHLKQMTWLEELHFYRSKITKEGVDELRKALPKTSLR